MSSPSIITSPRLIPIRSTMVGCDALWSGVVAKLFVREERFVCRPLLLLRRGSAPRFLFNRANPVTRVPLTGSVLQPQSHLCIAVCRTSSQRRERHAKKTNSFAHRKLGHE